MLLNDYKNSAGMIPAGIIPALLQKQLKL